MNKPPTPPKGNPVPKKKHTYVATNRDDTTITLDLADPRGVLQSMLQAAHGELAAADARITAARADMDDAMADRAEAVDTIARLDKAIAGVDR